MEGDKMKADIKNRLNRIEGQIRGIHRMIDNDEGCTDVLVQIAAVRSAINKVGGLILENYTKDCIKGSICNQEGMNSIDELIEVVLKFMK
ncbi:copper-sensing transcriptional repressor CsoR [Oxobacter pfennigii]|uniref:Copper-sensing transcriptional repressor CsoR n=1 Tax=Oxobacter pfennigii TaxID=36849 RepID=A0A0P8WAJ3_9CLOT|nr:metal-sensitive transcriptional regulator [Oxobacter pfennigii]KPU44977.1 copper-sensing transcriptional repressor CsoR [Oxobacter pfennigii]